MISKIEVALRVRLVEALLVYEDALILQDSSIFKEKKMYWQNMSTIASEILEDDKVTPSPAHNGLYQILLSMKYLRSSDVEWMLFVAELDKIIQKNISVVSLTAMNFPTDWKAHLSV